MYLVYYYAVTFFFFAKKATQFILVMVRLCLHYVYVMEWQVGDLKSVFNFV